MIAIIEVQGNKDSADSTDSTDSTSQPGQRGNGGEAVLDVAFESLEPEAAQVDSAIAGPGFAG